MIRFENNELNVKIAELWIYYFPAIMNIIHCKCRSCYSFLKIYDRYNKYYKYLHL